MSTVKRDVQDQMTGAIEALGVPSRLARRIAFQLVLKFDVSELGDLTVWRALGRQLYREVERLRADVGLVERQIVVALPKLSPEQIENLLDQLRTIDPKIARTILNAALDAANPLAAARRYLDDFHRVAEELKTIDPDIARTVANATFMARVPHVKALSHLKRFAELTKRFQDDVAFARTVAREAFRAQDPVKAAQRFIADYDAIVTQLTSDGIESGVARTFAAIACMGADPIPTAYKLLESFEGVLQFVQKTHPWIARSIALSACRAANPLSTARLYMSNYDTILRLVSVTDPDKARRVAGQVFRSDDPMRWARRYLAKLQTSRTG